MPGSGHGFHTNTVSAFLTLCILANSPDFIYTSGGRPRNCHSDGAAGNPCTALRSSIEASAIDVGQGGLRHTW